MSLGVLESEYQFSWSEATGLLCLPEAAEEAPQKPLALTTLVLSKHGVQAHGFSPVAFAQAHYHRLKDGAAYYGHAFPLSSEAMWHTLLADLCAAMFLSGSSSEPEPPARVVRFAVGLRPGSVYMALRPVPATQALRLKTLVLPRDGWSVKHSGYEAEDAAVAAAKAEGFDDILRVSPEGVLSETAYGNIVFKWRETPTQSSTDDYWVTPDCEGSQCLPGMMRQQLLATVNGAHLREQRCLYSDITGGRIVAAVVSNSVRGFETVTQIDATLMDDGTAALYALLNQTEHHHRAGQNAAL